MTTSSVPTVSEIPQHLKDTIISVLNSNGISKASVAAASVGVAIVELSKTHPDLVIDESRPFAETTSWLEHRPEIEGIILRNFDQYAEVVRDVYQEYAQEEVKNYVQDLAEELFGPGIEVESWSVAQISSDNPTPIVVSGSNLTADAPTSPVEDHDPETCVLCRDNKTQGFDTTTQSLTAGQTAEQPVASVEQPTVEALDVEAAADNVVPPYIRTGCGEGD